MEDLGAKSIELHHEHGGKIEVKSKVPIENRDDLSLAYTPGVGAVASAIGADKKLVYDLTIKKNTIAVVSDGSAILGLGNLGPEAALPVMEGKAALFKEFANIDAFPICLATQDVDEIVATVKNIAPAFGGINLEDISAPRCFEVEERLRAALDIPVMHDDQHGTAVVVLAALINALKLKNLDKGRAAVTINGAGAAGTAIANILLEYGFKDIVVCDSKGSIYEGRADLNSEKIILAKKTNPQKLQGSLSEVISGRDVFIGVSKAGALSPEMVLAMAKDPVVFAMANPVPEIMPEDAKKAGAFIVATGRSDLPNQINNVLAFPGIFRGALDNGIKQFKEEMFIAAAEAIAGHVQDLNPENIIPKIFDKGLVSVVAENIR